MVHFLNTFKTHWGTWVESVFLIRCDNFDMAGFNNVNFINGLNTDFDLLWEGNSFLLL